MSKYLCLSHILNQQTPSYGDKDCLTINVNSSIKNGDSANTSTWHFSNNHIGTHIDVPFHFCENGRKTHEYPIQDFVFNNVVLIDIACNSGSLISNDSFINGLNHNPEVDLLLIRTGFEQYRGTKRYWEENPGLSPDLAKFFRLNFPKLRCVGFDFISLSSWQHRAVGRESHREFLCPSNKQKEILIIEDMSLKHINTGIIRAIVAPLFVADGNGGAVTVFAEI
ncbi:MAG: cyclase family protein [Candidatus Margulisbacteria bacterium]|nr:cyclase family protein [Candidatus Margulisiibacteriota bacterium]